MGGRFGPATIKIQRRSRMQNTSEASLDENYAQCVDQLNTALRQLGVAVVEDRVIHTADLIIQTMTGAWRFFHTPGHIFDVGRTGDAIEILAALFHDAIHVQADNGVRVNIGFIISPYIREVEDSLYILSAEKVPEDPVFSIVCEIFDLKPGQKLAATLVQNEFLRALVASKCLQWALGLSEIAQIAACIEATIPFRKGKSEGNAPCDSLLQRLSEVNKAYGLAWTSEDIDRAVKRAVRLANRDVENFANHASAEFLNNTWNLMPETNHDLLGSYSYTVSGYRKSLQKMEAFMSNLSPEVVFQQFKEEPPTELYVNMLTRTARNLGIAKLYLGSKLLSIAVIEAISLRLGDEMPLASMMGELPQHGTMDAQLERFLPAVVNPATARNQTEYEVLELLEKGRTQESKYDVKHSPVATFVVKSLGFDRASELLIDARQFFDKQIASEQFLLRCNRSMVEDIVSAVERVFEVRIRSLRR